MRIFLVAGALALSFLVVPHAEAQMVATCHGQVATISGTDGDDELTGTSGDDVIQGLGGNDTITGGPGNDLVCGGAGNDFANGGGGSDVVEGGPGDDNLMAFGARPLAPPSSSVAPATTPSTRTRARRSRAGVARTPSSCSRSRASRPRSTMGRTPTASCASTCRATAAALRWWTCSTARCASATR